MSNPWEGGPVGGLSDALALVWLVLPQDMVKHPAVSLRPLLVSRASSWGEALDMDRGELGYTGDYWAPAHPS